MTDISATGFVFSLLTSFVAGIGVVLFFSIRKRRLRARIDELDEQEKHIQKIGSGYKSLLRLSLFQISLALGMACFALAINYFFDHEYFRFVGGILLFLAGLLLFDLSRSIYRSRDVEAESLRIQAKKDKLIAKLDDDV